jgi:predicted  nucleic acid-binding Zn-ribbon protein
MMITQCPKCGHQRGPLDDPEIPDIQCPACGIYYFKYLNQKSRLPTPQAQPKKNNKSRYPREIDENTAIKIWRAFCKIIANSLKALAPKIKLSHLFFGALVSAIVLQTHQTRESLNDPELIKRMKEEEQQKEALCKADLKCLGEKYINTILSPCSRLIEQHAKYQYRWDGLRFTRYNWANPEKSQIIYFGDAVQFQNGFSAWQNMIYSCTYDIKTNSITHAAVTPGRLPR